MASIRVRILDIRIWKRLFSLPTHLYSVDKFWLHARCTSDSSITTTLLRGNKTYNYLLISYIYMKSNPQLLETNHHHIMSTDNNTNTETAAAAARLPPPLPVYVSANILINCNTGFTYIGLGLTGANGAQNGNTTQYNCIRWHSFNALVLTVAILGFLIFAWGYQ